MNKPGGNFKSDVPSLTKLPNWKERLDLSNLSDREQAFLAVCQAIHRRDDGSTTPFEDFFDSLVTNVELGRQPTPEAVQGMLLHFQNNFETMAAIAMNTRSQPQARRHGRRGKQLVTRIQ